MFIAARWGFIPYWAKEPKPQINARCERIATSGMFRNAYRARRALMPIDGFFAPEDRGRWIGEEADPSDLMRPYPSHLMKMWPISTRVNSTSNDDPDILTPLDEGEQNRGALTGNGQ